MKTPLHKFNLLGVFLLTSYMTYSQSPPTGSPPAGNTAAQAAAAWYRGGNNPSGTAGFANIFGTMWNSPIYTVTDGVHRMRLNGTFTTNINGVNQNVDGFLGLGVNSYFATNSP